MQGWAAPVLFVIRLAEGWSWASVMGAVALGTGVLAILLLAFLVTLRR